MLASLDDRIRIMQMMYTLCRKNRMVYWLCKFLLRNIQIVGTWDIKFNDITSEEIDVLKLWIKDMVEELPYLRFISDRSQISYVMFLYRSRNASEVVFRRPSNDVINWMPKHYDDAQKWYTNAVDIILNEEVDAKTRNIMKGVLYDPDSIEQILERMFQTYHNFQDWRTYTLDYPDVDIPIDDFNQYSDITLTIWRTAIETAVQLIVNIGSRLHIATVVNEIFMSHDSDTYKLELLERLMGDVKQFDYLTPTAKRNVLVGGGVIYDSGSF